MKCHPDDSSFATLSTAEEHKTGSGGGLLTDDVVRLILRTAVEEVRELRAETRKLREENEELRGDLLSSRSNDTVCPDSVRELVQEQLGPITEALAALLDSPSCSSKTESLEARLEDVVQRSLGDIREDLVREGLANAASAETVCELVQEQMVPVASDVAAIKTKLDASDPASSKIEGLETKLEGIQRSLEDVQESLVNVSPETVRELVQEQMGPVASALTTIQVKLDAPDPASSKMEDIATSLVATRDSLKDKMDILARAVNNLEADVQGVRDIAQASTASTGDMLSKMSNEESELEELRGENRRLLHENEVLRDSSHSEAPEDVASPDAIRELVHEQLGPITSALATIENRSDAPDPASSNIEGLATSLNAVHESLENRMEGLAGAVRHLEADVRGVQDTAQASTASTEDMLSRLEALEQDFRAEREVASSDKQEVLDALQDLKDDHGNARRGTDLNGADAMASSELLSAGWHHSLSIRSDGTIKAWGCNGNGQVTVPAGLRDVTSISAGYRFSLALKADGTVAAWGQNDFGQTTVPVHLSGVTKVAAGGWHSLALLADKTVVVWGCNASGQTTVPANLENVRDIAAGDQHSLALLDSGNVVGWGHNGYGQATVPVGLNSVKAIAAGYDFSLALKNDGTVVGWGSGSSANIPAGLGSVKALSAGCQHSLALLENGTVQAWGDSGSGATDVPSGLESVVAIAAGFQFSLAMKADGSVVGWGSNEYGEVTIPEELRAP